jgi:hypothetical protein
VRSKCPATGTLAVPAAGWQAFAAASR